MPCSGRVQGTCCSRSSEPEPEDYFRAMVGLVGRQRLRATRGREKHGSTSTLPRGCAGALVLLGCALFACRACGFTLAGGSAALCCV